MPPSTEEHASGLGREKVRGKAISADSEKRAISPGEVPSSIMETEEKGSGSAAWVEREQVADGALGIHRELLLLQCGARAAESLLSTLNRCGSIAEEL